MFNSYGKARSLAPEFKFCIASAKAGIPCLLVAPPSGGKSTVIFGAEQWLSKNGEPTMRALRLGLRGLREVCDWLQDNKFGTIVNEDYAMIGSSEYMVEKMGEIVGTLSYSRSFQDSGLKINLKIIRLGFISGVQPLWLQTMMENPVFATHLREKFIRYYTLPYTPTPDIDMEDAIQIMSSHLTAKHQPYNYKIPKEFVEALMSQVGETRGKRYASDLARELSYISKPSELSRLLKFYAERIIWENGMIIREIEERGYEAKVLWHAYTGLFWCLRRGKLDRERMKKCLGVTSMRSVERVTSEGISKGWITSIWNNGEKHFLPSPAIKKIVGLK